MTDEKYHRCPYCESKAFWIKMFNVKTAKGEDVKSNCPKCNEDFSLEGVPSCGHSVCNRCFTNFKTISYKENNDRYITPQSDRQRHKKSPSPIIQKRNGFRSNEDSPKGNRYITPPPVRRHYNKSPPLMTTIRHRIITDEVRTNEDFLTPPPIISPSRRHYDKSPLLMNTICHKFRINEDRTIEDLLIPPPPPTRYHYEQSLSPIIPRRNKNVLSSLNEDRSNEELLSQHD
jgi:hypothetical protein